MDEWDLLAGTRCGNSQTYQCQIGRHFKSAEYTYCKYCGFSFIESSDEQDELASDSTNSNSSDSKSTNGSNLNNY